RNIYGNVGKPENILKYEEEIYQEILNIIEEKRKFIFEFKEEEKEKFKKIKVRFLKECPAIVGLDLKKYGPFKENDIALIIEEQAKILIENKFAEIYKS
ncbi:MAG: hypothetical protein ACK4YO_01260, partial [Candidatus Altarchaeaceae archaeon]